MSSTVSLPTTDAGRTPYRAARWLSYVLMAAALPWAFQVSQRQPVDRFLGELSYPIYLSHLLVIAVVFTLELSAWIAIAATLATSIVIYIGLDAPLDRRRQRRLITSQAAAQTESIEDGVAALAASRIAAVKLRV